MHYRSAPAVLLCLLIPLAAVAEDPPATALDNDRPKVAVVMGGGGAHGIAHLGVLKELERQRVPVDLIVSTGFGSLIGGLYASGMSVGEIETFIFETDWDNIFNPDTRREDLSFRRKEDDQDFLIKVRVGIQNGQAQLPRALIPNGKLAQLLQSATATTKGVASFDDLPVAFRSITMDLLTGDKVVLDSGLLSTAMLAAMTAPGTLPPVQTDGRTLITGGLIDNLPVDVARELGADIVIVVDIGVYIRGEQDLSSIFAIVDQVGHLLQKKNSEESIAGLEPQDVLVQPSLPLRAQTEVGEPEEKIKLAAESVAALADRWQGLRLSESEFVAYESERLAKRTLNPIITAIELENNSRVDNAVILSRITQPLNAELDKDALEQDLLSVYGLGEFEAVEFNLDGRGEDAVLKLRTVEKLGGNRFWRFGISLEDDLEGNSAYTASASLTWTSLNRLGGEWRSVARIGEVQQLSTEFYQPLVSSGRWFALASAGLRERNVNLFDTDGDILGQARVEERTASLQFGRIFGNFGQLAVGVLRGDGKTDSNIGSSIPAGEFDVGGYTATGVYDTYDNIYFPKRGATALLAWVGQRQSAGASLDVDIVSSSFGIARTWGVNSMLIGLRAESQLNDVQGTQNLVTTGGLFRLSGYQRDELSGKHTAVGRAIFYRQLRSNPLRGFLDASVYIGGSLELGNAWQTSDEVSLSNTITAGSLFVGADTFIGPVYFAGGLAEGGRSAFYLYVGRPF